MEKVQINNQIISMRKLVKQAKVHVINRLVKEVQSLKTRKGDETKITKHHRKAERFLLEISLIKKMNVDAVSKMALSSKKDWKHVISDKSVLLEERAMARLISFDFMQKEVQEFTAKNPRLVQILPDLIQEWEMKKQKISQSTKKLTAAEIKKRKTKSKLAESEELTHGVEESAASTESISPMTPSIKDKHKTTMKKRDTLSDSDELQESDGTSPDEVQSDLCDDDTDSFSEHRKGGKTERSINSRKLNRRNKLTPSNLSKKDYPDCKYSNKNEMSHKFKKLSGVDKSTKKFGRRNKEHPEHRLSNRKVRKENYSSGIKVTGANCEPCPVKNKQNLYSKFAKPGFDGLKKHTISMSSDRKNDSFKNAESQTPVPLHPSWEAKRKMNVATKSILPFQGKKIKFDE